MKKNILIRFFFFFTVALIAGFSQHSFGQGMHTTFGQNRVQYKDFVWSYYQSDNFVTYFYLGGQDVGKFVIQYCEKELAAIEQRLEYRLNKRIEILVYNNISDMNQTNIGLEQELYNTGGLTTIINNKIFVYFDGNHKNLERQLKEGIAGIFMRNMLFGGNFQEILQNAVLLNLPGWFTDGLVSYIGEEWNTDLDNKLRDGILSGKYKKFNRLEGADAKLAGHAIWHYIAEVYGKNSVPNLLYLTRINRSMESGFLFVLGSSVNNTIKNWHEHNLKRYTEELENKTFPSEENYVRRRPHRKQHIYQARINRDGKHIAYSSNNMGRYRVFVLNSETGKTKRVLRAGLKTVTLKTDYSFPLLAWSPNGNVLAAVYERKGKIYMLLYDLETNKKETALITKFQKVLDIAFTDDPRTLLLSAINIGQSDIYTYHIPSTRTEQITNDFYDDLQPRFVNVNGRRGIIFLSNRTSNTLKTERIDTTLPTGSFNLWFYNLATRSEALTQVTHSDFATETMPVQYSDEYFSFLSDENGIRNRHLGYFEQKLARYDTVVYFVDSMVVNPAYNVDSLLLAEPEWIDSVVYREVWKDTAITFPKTNYPFNLLEQDISHKAGKIAELFLQDGKFKIYKTPVDTSFDKAAAPVLDNTSFRNYMLLQEGTERSAKEKPTMEEPKPVDEPEDTVAKQPPRYMFQTEFALSDELRAIDTISILESVADDDPVFRLSRVLPYFVKFSTQYVITQFDNSIILTQYEKFSGSGGFSNPDLGAMFTLGITDLFEDYRLVGGFRVSFDFKGTDFFAMYENVKKRLDKQFLYYRKSQQTFYNNVVPFYNIPITRPLDRALKTRVKLNYTHFRLSLPFDVIRSLRWSAGYRNDRFVFLAEENFSLNLPPYAEHWLLTKLEYVHDNTIKAGLNILNGTRFKVYWEFQKQFEMKEKKIIEDAEVKLPSFNNKYLSVVGFDVRHYQKVHRQIIWANRFAAATSFGTSKLVYFLGGVDNWIPPKFDNSIPISNDGNYAFQTLATNMRGFAQNIRNGNSFAVINSEVRVPIFSYLLNSPIRSEFIKNFQLVGFGDVGTAWTGFNPYDEQNPLFTDIIGQPPVEVKVEYFRNPIVAGYGIGARTLIFGYFIRLDLAWGVDSGDIQPKMWHFSLGLDF